MHGKGKKLIQSFTGIGHFLYLEVGRRIILNNYTLHMDADSSDSEHSPVLGL
jgi:hypothetical protein